MLFILISDPIDINLYKGRGILVPGDELDQLTAYTGDTITIGCRFSLDTADKLFVTWGRAKKIVSINGVLANQDERLEPEEDDDTKTWKLTINEVSENDVGVWTCSDTVNSLQASINLAVIGKI